MILRYYKKLNNYTKNLNESKLLAGLAMIILNIFSKYVEINLNKSQEEYIRNTISREILLFTVIFIGTHDIIISVLMTAAFIFLSNTVFNAKSKLCLMPEKYKRLEKQLDINRDNYVSEVEIQNAKEILEKANKNTFK